MLKTNVKTNRMEITKWTYHKQRTFTTNYFIFLKKIKLSDFFFTRTSKFSLRINVFIFEGFQPQNGLIFFLFSMKHSYLLTTKITPYFNTYIVRCIMLYTPIMEISDYITKDDFDEIQVILL